MSKITQKYLSALFIPPFVVSTLASTSFLLLFQLFRITELIIIKNVAIVLVIELTAYVMATFLPLSTPLAVLFAGIYALNKLSADSELIVIRALGVSITKMFVPLFFMGLTIGALLFFLQYSFIPNAERSLRLLMTQIATRGVLGNIKEGKFFTEMNDITIYANKVKEKGKYLSQVFIHFREKSNDETSAPAASTGSTVLASVNSERIILAQEAAVVTRMGELNNNKLSLQLLDGNILKVNAKKDNKLSFEKILFDKYIFPLVDSSLISGSGAINCTRTTKELYDIVIKKSIPYPSADVKEQVKTKVEFYSRVNNALLCVVFLFLGFSLGVQRGRGKNQNSVVISMVVLAIYYSLLSAGISFARSGRMGVEVAVFSPTLLTFMISLVFYRRLKWVV
ncbi:MAG: LptF/LptG family permease [Oligoflexia bacterium]|nr:LptF/LptG family permease [Oligoflexia bacterium]